MFGSFTCLEESKDDSKFPYIDPSAPAEEETTKDNTDTEKSNTTTNTNTCNCKTSSSSFSSSQDELYLLKADFEKKYQL